VEVSTAAADAAADDANVHPDRKKARGNAFTGSGSASESPAPANGHKGARKPAGERFSRIKDADVSFHDDRLRSNAFDTKVRRSAFHSFSAT
jgi:hypothetical protein